MTEMETKTKTNYVDNNLGFPVIFSKVTLVKMRGEWIADINMSKVSDLIFRSLPSKPVRLTGNEIRFIRLKLEMTLEKFGSEFNVSHVTVMNWEKCADKPTKMKWAAEKDIRLFIRSQFKVGNNFYSVYKSLKEERPSKKCQTKIKAKSKQEYELVVA
jgi:DNA-binding transcriptional regulator YiaG